MGDTLSPQLRIALAPLLSALETITARIREYDAQIVKLAEESYPDVALLKQVKGVGTLIALTYILTLEDPRRFRKSRDAGCYVGLQPGRRNSGQSEPQLHITREGDSYLRMALVQGAQHILGPFGEDSDLRRWGLKLAEHGGKSGRNARSSRWPANWQFCCIISGSAARSTNRSTMHGSAGWQRHSWHSSERLNAPQPNAEFRRLRPWPGPRSITRWNERASNRWQRRLYREHPMCTERISRSPRVRMEG